jgi:hypothetical protein
VFLARPRKLDAAKMTVPDRRVIATVKRASSIVLRALKRTFPEDFDRRCIYAAAGIKHLLTSAGIDARMCGGDFLALVVSKDGSRAMMQGFGGASGELNFSHYWVETPRLLVDLGLHLLPRGSSFPAVAMPVLAWDKAEPLYTALRYRALEIYAPDAKMSSPDDITQRMSVFLDDIEKRGLQKRNSSTFPVWLLTGESSLHREARRDVWASAVLRFEREADISNLPF